ncbi:MAG TPA: 5'-3' exonuclease [Actinomycetota bacterium]|nr:5'-3' exonuclease [Actinomycetota bacterium]
MDTSLTLLVDAPSLIYRAFFSTPDTTRAPDGRLVNAAAGFFNMLARFVSDHRPDLIACAADSDWRPQWRVDLIDTYKSHRAAAGSAQEQAEDLIGPQVVLIYELLSLIGIAVVGHEGNEAEDVIGTLAARSPGRAAIVSGDRDLFQLVEDPRCYILYPRRGAREVTIVDEAYIAGKYGIPGRAYKDFAILRGDPSDGLPGVRGIGEKTAASLVARYGSLIGILEAISQGERSVVLDKVKASVGYLERAVQVVTIPTDLPLAPVDVTAPRPPFEAAVTETAVAAGLSDPVQALLAALGR